MQIKTLAVSVDASDNNAEAGATVNSFVQVFVDRCNKNKRYCSSWVNYGLERRLRGNKLANNLVT
jgi:hypothetical protein